MRRTSLVVLLLLSLMGLAAPAQAVPYDGIYGTVTDARTGAPLQGMTVHEEDASGSGYNSVTGADGSYEIPPSGQASLTVSDPAGIYRSVTVPVSAGPGGQPVRQDFALSAYASLSGRVTDSSGNPVAGICVAVHVVSGSATAGSPCTAADGTYRLPVTAAATVQVEFVDTSQTYLPQWFDGVRTQAKAKTFKAGTSDVRGINARLERASSLTVGLRNAGGTPQRGCLTASQNGVVVGSGCAYEPGTDPVVRGLAAGTYVVEGRAFDRTLVRRSTSVTVRAAQDVTAPALVLPVGGAITGRAVDSAGNPVPGVCASVLGLDERTFPGPGDKGLGCDETYETGEFAITGLDAGTYPVEVSELYYGSTADTWVSEAADSRGARRFDVALGQTVSLGDVVLAPQGTVSGTVTGVEPWTQLAAYSAATGEQVGHFGFVDETGHYVIGGLGTNDYVVQLLDGSGTYAPGVTSVKKARTVHVESGADTGGVDLARR